MTTFRVHDDVAVVEHDPDTRQPKEGGQVHRATVLAVEGIYVKIRNHVPTVHGRPDFFYAESGWRAWDGSFRWRLVPLCRCEKPILTGDDPFCSDECRDDAAAASYEQRYQPGVAT